MAQSCVAMAGIASSLLHPSLSSPSLLTPHTHTHAPLPRLNASLPSPPSLHACLTPPSHHPPPSPTRRSFLPLLLASSAPALLFTKEAHAAASSIKIQGPPPPSGGLPGTENADQARDVELPLKNRFYIQPLSPPEAAARAKESAKDIIGVKALIDKKAWPYVQNDLRLKASYLRFDLNTIVASKPKDERKALKSVIAKLFDTIDSLDYAARSKSVPNAEKYYAETASILNDVLAKIS